MSDSDTSCQTIAADRSNSICTMDRDALTDIDGLPWDALLEQLRANPKAPGLRAVVCERLATPQTARVLCRALRMRCGFTAAQWRAITGCGGVVVGGMSVAILSGSDSGARDEDQSSRSSGSAKRRSTAPAQPDIDILCVAPPAHQDDLDDYHQQWARLRPVLGKPVEIDRYDKWHSGGSLSLEFPGGAAHSTRLALWAEDCGPWEYRYGAIGSDHVIYESQRARLIRSLHRIEAEDRRPARGGLPVQIVELVAPAAARAVQLARSARYLPPGAVDTDVVWAARATFDFPLAALLAAGRAPDEKTDCDLAARDWPAALEWAGGTERVVEDLLLRRMVYKRMGDSAEPVTAWADEGLTASRWTAAERLAKWRGRGWTVVPSPWAWLRELRGRCQSWLVLPKLVIERDSTKRPRSTRGLAIDDHRTFDRNELELDRLLVDIIDGASEFTSEGQPLHVPEFDKVVQMCRSITASGRTKRRLVRQLLDAAEHACVAVSCACA